MARFASRVWVSPASFRAHRVLSQPCGLIPHVLKGIAEHAQRCFGVYAKPERHGGIRAGDAVGLDRQRESTVGRWVGVGAISLKRIALRAAAALMPKE